MFRARAISLNALFTGFPYLARMSTSQTLLLVDDSPSFLDLTATILRRRGYYPILAMDGEAAVDLAGAERPDAIILDIGMPGLDGFEVLSRLRQCSSTASIPVLMITGHRSEQDVRLALALGANGYLVKPFTTADLLARLRRVLHTEI
jgi:DNA-binding response OmpR family regulator